MDHAIEELAQQISRRSHGLNLDGDSHALKPTPGSPLDPHSPSFHGRSWVKAFMQLMESDPNVGPSRVLGVAFQNLNVLGWSAGAAVQPTVPNRLSHIFSLGAQLFSAGRHGQRVEILRDFEGVVGEGELLLVLGPPGSGCSTLLKTLAGETSGLKVSPESYMNFRGT